MAVASAFNKVIHGKKVCVFSKRKRVIIMRILVISEYSNTVSSRPEAAIFMALQRDPEIQVDVMTDAECEFTKKFRDLGMGVSIDHPKKKFSRSNIKNIRKRLIEGKYDILHLFNSKAAINGIWAAMGLPVKVALYRGYAGNIFWYDPSAYLKYLHPRVDRVFCIAEAVEEHVAKAIFWNPKKVVTIRKGHDPAWYADVDPIDVRREFNLPENSFVAVCVANTRPMKGIPYLVEAMNLIPEDLPIYLILVGRGLDTEEVVEIVNRGAAKKRVIFAGFRKDALRIDKGADCFVLASLYGEAITKAVIEAMSVGTAPLITAIPGNKYLVINESSGLVVPKANAQALADGLLRYYKDEAFRKEMAAGALHYIQTEFHCNKTAEGYKAEYQKMLAE